MSATRKKTRSKNLPASRIATGFPIFSTGEEFDSLSNEEKERVAVFYSEGLHRDELRPLSATERAELKADRAKTAKRRVPDNTILVISLSVTVDLLKRADAYAKAHGLKRAELVEQALHQLLQSKIKLPSGTVFTRRQIRRFPVVRGRSHV